jgi:hypothetical protein
VQSPATLRAAKLRGGWTPWCRRWATASKTSTSSHKADRSPFTRPGALRDTPDVETTDWRAVCGKTARTVRRAGRATNLPDPYRERGSPGSINTGGASSARSVVMGSGLAPSARPGTTTEVISRMSYKDYWWRALRGAPSGPSCRDGDPRCSDILAPGRRALIFVKVVAASMSGSGQTRTFQPRWLMSAIPPIAEVLTRSRRANSGGTSM